MEREYMADQD